MTCCFSALLLIAGAAAAFAQVSSVELNGSWEFEIDILGDRNVHRFHLQMAGSKVTGRGMFGVSLSGGIEKDAIRLTLGDPGRELGRLSGRIHSDTDGVLMSGDGMLYEGAAKWTARRPAVRSGAEPVLHEFQPGEYHRVITSSVAPALKIFSGDTVRTRTIDANGYDHRNVRVAPGGDPLVGPFFVHGALVGDTLAVTIKKIRLTRDSATSGTMIMMKPPAVSRCQS